jgi:hypothetical protein
MAPKISLLAISLGVLGVLYQVILRDVLFVVIGIDRKLQGIEEFPYECRRLTHPLLESCEDLVLDGVGRRVYAACSTIESRMGWAPKLVILFLVVHLNFMQHFYLTFCT